MLLLYMMEGFVCIGMYGVEFQGIAKLFQPWKKSYNTIYNFTSSQM